MGLDNGIEVRRTPITEAIPEMRLFEDDWSRKYKTNYEVCYWRKCYNIRNRILDVVEKYEPLTVEDIDRIVEVLKSVAEDNWDDDGGSIWGFEDMVDRLGNQIRDLGILRRLMLEYELEVYFYDSY